METRGMLNVYLLGSYESEILGAKLPSMRQAFGYFLHLHKVEKKTVRDASRETIQTVNTFWSKAGIPVRAQQHCIQKLEKLFTEWRGLQKHKSRTTPSQKTKEDVFVARLDNLFDIAHADALSLITIPEDRAFLLSQRQKGRPGSIGSVDKVHELQSLKAQQRAERELKRRQKSNQDMETLASQVVLTTDSSSGDETEVDEDQDLDPSVNVSTPVSAAPKRARINIVSPGVAAALDRTRLSSRNAAYVLSEVASSLGHDISDFNINRNSIHRTRSSHRASMASNLRSEFSTSVPLTVHWDGKLMEDLTSHEHVDRLPVLISGVGVEQLLGVPKLPSGTGEAQASAVVNSLGEWGITDQVCALCFDTTASNTGHRSGACVLIEQKLERDLLYMACRHHIMELVVGAAFEKTVGSACASTGPDILLFKRFKEHWPYIDRQNFKPAASEPAVETLVAAFRQDILAFTDHHLKFEQPRDDYREFLELSVIFIGGTLSRGIHFQLPGAMHRARWMSKVIYAIKMWLFREQFKMTAAEQKGICELAIFAVLVHLRAWLTAPLPAEAPLNDFRLMKQLLEYPNPAVSSATSKKLGLHLWYLSEELIGLALFDPRLPAASKTLMIAAMNDIAPEHPPKCPRIETKAFVGDKGLEQFCTANSKKLFDRLRIPCEFLTHDPSQWLEDNSYQQALKVVRGLAVCNDRAERGVALIQDYNKKLTTGEEQLQFLLQVVVDHRRRFPDCNKATFLAGQSKLL